jgi:glutathione S-transferase
MSRGGGYLAIVVRIPFSHYCRKVEWGLSQAGIPYRTWDLLPTKARRLADATQHGLVPVLITDDGIIEGSDHILPWAAQRAAQGTPPLYPDDAADEVRRWEQWAGDEVGPVARREAYRVWYEDPGHLTTRRIVHFVARPTRKLALGILKHYKARRYDEADRAAIPGLFARIRDGLADASTGYLVTDAPTAADLSVAALAEPFLHAAPGRDYDATEGWAETAAFVRRVRPRKVLRRGSTWMRQRHWKALAEKRSEGKEEEAREPA